MVTGHGFSVKEMKERHHKQMCQLFLSGMCLCVMGFAVRAMSMEKDEEQVKYEK